MGETLLSKYICDNNSICREERQYALYLYNALLAYNNDKLRNSAIEDIVKNIFGADEGDNLQIDNVFYEATFMRDLHEYNRRCCYLASREIAEDKGNLYLYKKPSIREYSRVIEQAELDCENSFNWKLFSYLREKRKILYNSKALVLDEEQRKALTKERLETYFLETEKLLDFTRVKQDGEIKNDDDGKIFCEEYHLGQSKDFKVENNIVKQDIRSMMNAKPDIAVIYHHTDDANTKYLLFIECKFESAESKDGIRTQTCIQYMIADFLCSKWVSDGNGSKRKLTINDHKFGCDISSLMGGDSNMPGQSLKVVFYRKFNNREKADTSNERYIDIEKLIQINKEIFGVDYDKNQNSSR